VWLVGKNGVGLTGVLLIRMFHAFQMRIGMIT
jgi:hypothetical protein